MGAAGEVLAGSRHGARIVLACTDGTPDVRGARWRGGGSGRRGGGASHDQGQGRRGYVRPAARDRGRPGDALRHARHARRAVARLSRPQIEGPALTNMGRALRSLDRLDEARAQYCRALPLVRRAGMQAAEAEAHHMMALVLARTDGATAAQRHLRRALATYTELGRPGAGEVARILAGPREAQLHHRTLIAPAVAATGHSSRPWPRDRGRTERKLAPVRELRDRRQRRDQPQGPARTGQGNVVVDFAYEGANRRGTGTGTVGRQTIDDLAAWVRAQVASRWQWLTVTERRQRSRTTPPRCRGDRSTSGYRAPDLVGQRPAGRHCPR